MNKKKGINLKPKKDVGKLFPGKERLIMYLGVTIITLFVFIFWLSNLNNFWGSSVGVEEKNNLNELREIINNPIDFGDEDANDNDNEEKDDVKKDADELFEGVIDNVEKKSTSTSNTNCPEWINCMPTIGEARPCVIPPGCEGITQIAY